ncbi:MAG: hypothetical protein AB1442_06210, partial [Nitrospirota bacterium]
FNTRFINSNGLPGPGQYTTASDLAKVMSYALRYPKLKDIIGTRVAEVTTERGRTIWMRNTNRLLWSEADLVGGKTGYTHSAQHCFVCAAERGSDTIIIALLGSPSRDTLWRESEFLISKGFSVIENNDEPQIYLTSANYDDIVLKKAVHKKSYKKKIKSSKKKKSHKTMIAKKHKGKKKGHKTLMAKKHESKKKTVLAKKKGKSRTKTLAKKKIRKKNYRVAEKNRNGRTKG